MARLILIGLLITLAISCIFAKPAGIDLDNVSGDDPSLNAVDPIKPSESGTTPSKNTASVQITGISTGIDNPPNSQDDSGTPFKPQRAGTMFARFIDDIFNIPITVLQSVAKLITNPFTTKNRSPDDH
ncbi:hypothetical protein HHI36_009473 [Cryptolaemus montrouzieri]|uniref:Uncharacterized protein n=1 Tax=Cryptolaemus montrouzieri TaxID=559131 RepID=A0ABD2MFZ0_9CUCU